MVTALDRINYLFYLCKRKNYKRAAFTLAEVLITLGIIGVVAALTLPTLISNHQKQTYVTGLKKAYSNFSNAFNKMAYDEDVTDWSSTYCAGVFGEYEGPIEGRNYSTTECLTRLKKQFRIATDKFPNNFKIQNSNEVSTALITTDGIIYVFECSGSTPVFYVDVNGTKGPNQAGRDQFAFYINTTKNKIEPFGIVDFNGNEVETWKTCSGSNLSQDCTAKVIIEGKMDY